MALVEMQKISVCALKKNRKKTLETLQHLGVLELTTEEINDPDLGHMDTSAARGRFLRRSERFESALKVLAEYAPVKTGLLDSLAGKKEISRTEADDVQKSMEKCYNDAQTVNRLAKEITDTKGEILKNENRKTSLEPWMKLDVSMAFKGTKKTRALIGTMPGARTAEEIYAIASEGLEGEGRVSVDEINAAMKSAVTVSFGYNDEEIVSKDIIGMDYGSLFDSTQTLVVPMEDGNTQVQVAAWYDNEHSYVQQMIRTLKYLETMKGE